MRCYTTLVDVTEDGYSVQLKARFSNEWHKAHVDHPFIEGIRDGSLSMARFSYFMRQDYLFLIEYCRVIALAVAKSTDLATMGWWARLLNETLHSEMDLHRSFCADFSITREDLENTEIMPATAAYTDYLVRIAFEGTVEEIAATLLPCQWGYDEIGRRLSTSMTAPEGSFHHRWVAGYTAPEYQQVTDWLRRFFDEQAAAASSVMRNRMADAFVSSIRHELNFWQAAWDLQGWLER